jgi:hypothetical protein
MARVLASGARRSCDDMRTSHSAPFPDARARRHDDGCVRSRGDRGVPPWAFLRAGAEGRCGHGARRRARGRWRDFERAGVLSTERVEGRVPGDHESRKRFVVHRHAHGLEHDGRGRLLAPPVSSTHARCSSDSSGYSPPSTYDPQPVSPPAPSPSFPTEMPQSVGQTVATDYVGGTMGQANATSGGVSYCLSPVGFSVTRSYSYSGIANDGAFYSD